MGEAGYQIMKRCGKCRMTYKTTSPDRPCPYCAGEMLPSGSGESEVVELPGRSVPAFGQNWLAVSIGSVLAGFSLVIWAGAANQLSRHSYSALYHRLMASGHPGLASIASPAGLAVIGLISCLLSTVLFWVSRPPRESFRRTSTDA